MGDWLADLEMLQLFGICILIALFLFKNYVTPYARKKGENLATKQDIAEITDEIEKVRSVYAERLEDISQQNRVLVEQAKRKHQLSIAALDRRLEAHQQAYTLWRKLRSVLHKDEVGSVVIECQDWWVENCLYLDAEARQAFLEAYHAAFAYREHAAGNRESPEGSEIVKENFMAVLNAGDMIVKGVELPSLGDGEYKPVELSAPGES